MKCSVSILCVLGTKFCVKLYLYSIDCIIDESTLHIMKRNPNSLTGLVSKSYTLQLESEFENNIIYGTELRYKYINNQIMLNISDLTTLGFTD